MRQGSAPKQPQETFPTAQRPDVNVAPPQSAPAKVASKPAPEEVPAPAPTPAPTPAPEERKATVVPDTSLAGKVVSVNANLRFVVLNFPIGHMAAVDQQLNVYRQGQKVGVVKVTGPQQDDNIIADISEGEAQAGDEVRQN